VDNSQQPIFLGLTEREISIFVFGVVRIKECHREWISKHGSGLLEGDPMRLEVARGLIWVPFESHEKTVAQGRSAPGGREADASEACAA